MWAAHSHPHPLQRTSDQPVGSVETIVIDCNKLFRLNPSGAPHLWQFPHCLEWSRPRSPQCSDWHHHSCPTRNQIWVKIVSKKVYINQLRPEIGPQVLHLHHLPFLLGNQPLLVLSLTPVANILLEAQLPIAIGVLLFQHLRSRFKDLPKMFVMIWVMKLNMAAGRVYFKNLPEPGHGVS